MKNDIKWQYIIIAGFSILYTILGLHVGIFWDNVLFVGQIGTFLYEHNPFDWFALPISVSSHPCLCGTYYAIVWRLFGRSLLVSHLATFPIVFGVLYQIWQLCAYFFAQRKEQLAAWVLVCASPTLCSHCVQLSQELFILFFFFYALNSILRKEHLHKAIALCFLPLCSYRAMMLCAGLFFAEWGLSRLRSIPFWTWKSIGSYFGGVIISVVYLIIRLNIFSGTPNPMGFNYFEYTSIGQIIYIAARNAVVLVWRYLDFGQITIFIVIATLLLLNKNEITHSDSVAKELLICAILPVCVLLITSIFAANQMGHHYFLPSFVLCILLSFYLLKYSKKAKVVYSVMLLSLLAGNLIVYPEKISQGWQNSLAHLPYWSLRRQAIEELDRRQIPMEETATFFPNEREIDFIELNGDQRSFCPFTGKEEYVFYSSCYNPSDEEIDILHTQYEPLVTCRKGRVYVQVLQRANLNP